MIARRCYYCGPCGACVRVRCCCCCSTALVVCVVWCVRVRVGVLAFGLARCRRCSRLVVFVCCVCCVCCSLLRVCGLVLSGLCAVARSCSAALVLVRACSMLCVVGWCCCLCCSQSFVRCVCCRSLVAAVCLCSCVCVALTCSRCVVLFVVGSCWIARVRCRVAVFGCVRVPVVLDAVCSRRVRSCVLRLC